MHHLRHLLLVTVLAPALALSDEPINYCHDPAAAAEWKQLMLRHEGDPDFRYQYSLRRELCGRVDAGELSLDAAIDRFEDERERVIQNRRKRLERLEQMQGGTG